MNTGLQDSLKCCALVAFLSLVSLGASAQPPLDVAVSQSQFATFTSVTTDPELTPGDPMSVTNITVSRTTTSLSPIADEIDQTIPANSYSPGAGTVTSAIANAGDFAVSDSTGWGFANASATTRLWFSPVADQTTSIGVQISVFNLNYTAGSATLLDLTANSVLWNYSWSGRSGGVPEGGIDYNPVTSFFASDQYELTLNTSSDAGDDIENAQILLTGLAATPEPSSISLLLAALLGIPVLRRFAFRKI